jgi:hypothetical protein
MEHLESIERLAAEEDARRERVRPQIEEIALRASYSTDIKRAIEEAPSRAKATIAVREQLRKEFLADIDKIESPLVATASNEYEVAKTVVELLWKK